MVMVVVVVVVVVVGVGGLSYVTSRGSVVASLERHSGRMSMTAGFTRIVSCMAAPHVLRLPLSMQPYPPNTVGQTISAFLHLFWGLQCKS